MRRSHYRHPRWLVINFVTLDGFRRRDRRQLRRQGLRHQDRHPGARYAAAGIKTGTLVRDTRQPASRPAPWVRDARQLCPDVITVQANHRLYTDYHERIPQGARHLHAGREGLLDRRKWPAN
jgi:hypothetical protein